MLGATANLVRELSLEDLEDYKIVYENEKDTEMRKYC